MLKNLIELKNESFKYPIVQDDILNDYKIPDDIKNDLSMSLNGYEVNNYTSWVITSKANKNRNDQYAIIPNQYFAIACEVYDFAIELYKYIYIFDKVRVAGIEFKVNYIDIKEQINQHVEISRLFENESDIDLFSKFIDRSDLKKNNSIGNIYRLGAKSLFDKSGARGKKECFGSVILQVVNMPNSSSSIFGDLVFDLVENEALYTQLTRSYEQKKNRVTPQQQPISLGNHNDFISLSKPFVLLAGISGTGKSRFVRQQVGEDIQRYCLVSVRPDWHEPSDLFGYISRIGAKPKYVATKVIRFITAAWKAVFSVCDNPAYIASYHLKPFWLCLDEMNLAPVEQYFADYLAVLESRKFEKGIYTCEPLIDSAQMNEASNFRHEISLGEEDIDHKVWDYFKENGIGIPPNLIVAGTVNMDETTHGFSRKVIDRAITIDFGEFFPNDYDDYLIHKVKQKRLTYSMKTTATGDNFVGCEVDTDGKKTINFLKEVNNVLKHTFFELAYRALNELLLSVECMKPKSEEELQAVWDDFLMTKVLPRMEGDEDKFQATNTESSNLLEQLNTQISKLLEDIWNNQRVDFYRENIDGSPLSIDCRSKKKLKWMSERLSRDTFTSFWP